MRAWAAKMPAPRGDTPAQRQRLAMTSVLSALSGAPAAVAADEATRALSGPESTTTDWTALSASMALCLADHSTLALSTIDSVIERSRVTATPWTNSLALSCRAYVLIGLGEIAEAAADAHTSLAVAEQLPWGDRAVGPRIWLAAALAEQGKKAWEYHHYLMVGGRVRRTLGDLEGALTWLRRCEHSLAEAGIVNAMFMPWWRDAACILAELGREDEAAEAAEHGMRLAEIWDTPRARGLALLAKGMSTGEIELLDAAVDALAESPAKLEQARANHMLGRTLLNTGHKPDARPRLRQAVDLGVRCGAMALAAAAREDLIAAGGRMHQVSPRRTDTLTGSERRVALMAAGGRTNREIAEALFITLRTVELHLTNAYRKLGVGKRTELTPALGESP